MPFIKKYIKDILRHLTPTTTPTHTQSYAITHNSVIKPDTTSSSVYRNVLLIMEESRRAHTYTQMMPHTHYTVQVCTSMLIHTILYTSTHCL